MQKYYVTAVVKKYMKYHGNCKPEGGFDLVGLVILNEKLAERKNYLDCWVRSEQTLFLDQFSDIHEESNKWNNMFFKFYESRMKDLYAANAEITGTLEMYFIPHGECCVGSILDALPKDSFKFPSKTKKDKK